MSLHEYVHESERVCEFSLVCVHECERKCMYEGPRLCVRGSTFVCVFEYGLG